MTREEAIKHGKEQLEVFGGEHREFIEIAIKALEQEPCEDCISRQAVLEKINDWWGITSTSGEPTLCDCIRDLPPVTPTRKKGKWIDGHCSECGCDVPAYIDDWKWIKDMDAKFCPKCGIEMEVEE